MTHHKIKCWPKYFNATTSGQKPFDVRLNDRDSQVDDIVTLEEWDPDTKEYTGRVVTKTITYVLFAERAVDGLISSQTCVLGFGVSPGPGG
jgi:hypothetical protein